MGSALRRGGLVLFGVLAAPADGLLVLARASWAARAEILHAGAIVLGWTLVTWGVASLLVWEVWPISGGLFLLSLSGWGHLRMLFATGLYALVRIGRK